MRSFRLDKCAPTKAFQNITAQGPEGWGVESLPSNLLRSWGMTLNFSFSYLYCPSIGITGLDSSPFVWLQRPGVLKSHSWRESAVEPEVQETEFETPCTFSEHSVDSAISNPT